MSRTLQVTISDDLYQQAEEVAQISEQAVADVLSNALAASPTIFHINPERAAMLRENAAFRQMHADLLRQYSGEYVAILQGKVIDHDQDLPALLQRRRHNYPGLTVLIRQVLPESERILHFRSPRLVRE
jgi:hypothetical protein